MAVLQRDLYTILAILSFIVGFAFLEVFYWYFNIPRQPILAGIIAAGAIVYGYFKNRELRRQFRNIKLGRDGERDVGQALEELRGNGYAIFHDIVGDNFNIDHVIVSPNGIFVIETKTVSRPSRGMGKVIFDGQKVALTGHLPDDKPITQAIMNTKWIRQMLKESTGKDFAVKPVLVYPGWFVETSNNSNQIWVMNPKMLQWEIPKEIQSLTPEEMHTVAFHLSNYIKLYT